MKPRFTYGGAPLAKRGTKCQQVIDDTDTRACASRQAAGLLMLRARLAKVRPLTCAMRSS
jgi:hypothetical protein